MNLSAQHFPHPLAARGLRPVAEATLVEFARLCEVQTPDDLRHALEMLIGKSARAVEKYCGTSEALTVLNRTTFHLLPTGGRA